MFPIVQSAKKRVLLIGSGGIGTITALNLELSGECAVTAVLRSNYKAVKENGFKIDAIDYGTIDSWRPTQVRNSVPDVVNNKEEEEYEYVVCTTKNTPDVPPPMVELIKPAVTPGRSVIVLIQNGINIEKPIVEAFPHNVVLSGISRMGANELRPGFILQDDQDRLGIAPFDNPNLAPTECSYDGDFQLRLIAMNENYADADPVALLVRPAMKEVIAVAKSAGITLEPELIDLIVEAEPVDSFCVPSMLQDARKGRPMEVENILGEVTRTADKNQVPVPVIKVLYALLKARQWRTIERNGMIDLQGDVEKRKKEEQSGK
ncbi:hypothetical protein DV736_g3808, partial [Chaetothyriales sp. CBS 134916]